MYFCYVDESGGFEAPGSGPSATPVLVLAGLIVPVSAIEPLTADFLALKRGFYPGRVTHQPDDMLVEIKGSSLRRRVRAGTTRQYSHALGVLGGVVGLIETHDIRIIGRIWVKGPATTLDPDATYTSAVQDMSRQFDHFLGSRDSKGLVVCDARGHRQDMRVAHSVFALKHGLTGDSLPHLMEAPLFAKSDNHAGIQLADIMASALLYPMAARVYCPAIAHDPHTDPEYDQIRQRFAERLGARRYLYRSRDGRAHGGIVVSDELGRQPSHNLFRLPEDDP